MMKTDWLKEEMILRMIKKDLIFKKQIKNLLSINKNKKYKIFIFFLIILYLNQKIK